MKDELFKKGYLWAFVINSLWYSVLEFCSVILEKLKIPDDKLTYCLFYFRLNWPLHISEKGVLFEIQIITYKFLLQKKEIDSPLSVRTGDSEGIGGIL